MDATSEIDESTGTITRTLRVEAPRELVFEVLTQPAQIAQWFGQSADFPDGVVEGACGTFEWVGHGLFPMRVERAQAPSRLDLRWDRLGDQSPREDASLVEFTLTPVGPDRTLVTVVETGFAGEDLTARRAAMEENVTGWRLVLDSLVRYVEGRAAEATGGGR